MAITIINSTAVPCGHRPQAIVAIFTLVPGIGVPVPVALPAGRMHHRLAACIGGVIAVLLAGSSHAAAFTFTPFVNLSETYTDNVRLSNRGTEQSAFVTQVAPGFALTNNSPRLQLRMNYTLQALLYSNADIASQTFSLADASLHAIVVPDFLLFDGRGSVGQQNNSAFGPLSTGNVNVTGNRSNVRTYSLSPYLVHRFDGTATAQLRYAHEAVNTGTVGTPSFTSLLGNSSTDRLAFNVNSGTNFRIVTWGAAASTERTRYGSADSVDQSTYSGNVAYLLTPAVRLTATAGYEKNTYVTLGAQPQGTFYSTGLIWTPTSRTSVTATIGHRYFGRTAALAISERLRNAVLSISYNEDITSSQAQALSPQVVDTAALLNQTFLTQIPDALARQQVVSALILQNGLASTLLTPVNALVNQYFLQKSFQASIALNGRRNTLVGTVFDIRRLPQSLQSPTLSQLNLFDANSRQTGITGLWSYQLSPRSSANANLSYTHNTSLTSDQQNTYKVARISMATAFQPRLHGSIELRHSQQSANYLGGDIRENAITAALLMQF